jgi:hypothetical protein
MCLALTGCIQSFVKVTKLAPQDISSLESRVSVYKLTEAVRKDEFAMLGPVAATSCQNNFITDGVSSESDALAQLRYYALQLNGNTVLDVTCTKEGVSLSKNCWNAVVCQGTAAKRDPALKSERLAMQPTPEQPGLIDVVANGVIDQDGFASIEIRLHTNLVSLSVNGSKETATDKGLYSVRRFAQLGANQFEVVATDRFGNTQRQTVSVVREPADTTVRFATLNPGALRGKPANNAVAIIIGIQDYRRVPKAEFANNDARVFYDYAIRGLGVRPENVKLLVDQQADDVEILGAFKNWLPLKAKRGQTDVYVFYSGHGLPSDDGSSLYFLPHGVDRQFLDRTAIKQAEIVSALQAVSPKSVTLFLDACYSGQSRGGETLLASARPIAIQPKASTFPSNFTVLSASAPEQIASSSPDLKHGIFSYFLMKGMEGEADQNKDGAITVQEMQAYLSESVGRKAMSINRTQQPQLAGDQNRTLLIK